MFFSKRLQGFAYLNLVFNRIEYMPKMHFRFFRKKTCILAAFYQSWKYGGSSFVTRILLVLNIIPAMMILFLPLLFFYFEIGIQQRVLLDGCPVVQPIKQIDIIVFGFQELIGNIHIGLKFAVYFFFSLKNPQILHKLPQSELLE